jgi:hypothetical protein
MGLALAITVRRSTDNDRDYIVRTGLTTVSVLASLIPAFGATRVDPVGALRGP